jgi:Phage tail assembly chaperone protein
MTMFFSPSETAFYDDLIHGPRRIPAPQSTAEVKAKKRPKLIDNPDCRIPVDAVPVKGETYRKIQQELSEGHQLVERGGRPATVQQSQQPPTEEQNRARRDRLLAQSDWTQLLDVQIGAEEQSAWQSYRQQLRDLDMENPSWPVAPGADENGGPE